MKADPLPVVIVTALYLTVVTVVPSILLTMLIFSLLAVPVDDAMTTFLVLFACAAGCWQHLKMKPFFKE